MNTVSTPNAQAGHRSTLDTHLSISSHVVVQLGSELVSDIEQALLELAKNAYDADSDTCEIIVEPDWQITSADPVYDLLFPTRRDEKERINQTVGRVQIRDYGEGIPEAAVARGWLRISASLKRADSGNGKQKTKKNRTPVGDKGLGRLATMKIGTVLRMKTAIEGEKYWRAVSFSWGDFTSERTLDEVRVVTEVSDEAVDQAGTVIEVIGLHEPARWADQTFIEKELVPRLSSLISPFQSRDNFSITVSGRARTHELETLHDDVLNLASAKFTFDWNGNTLTQRGWIAPSLFSGANDPESKARFDHYFSAEIRPKLLDHLVSTPRLHDKNVRIEDSLPWLLAFSQTESFLELPVDKLFPGGRNPGAFKAEIYSYSFSPAIKQKLQQAGLSTTQLQAMANIAIYRDGFRIRTPGDWLRLSASSTKGGSYYELKPSNVLGFFALTNEFNSELVEKSDREGFVDNREFRGFMILSQRCKDYANQVLESLRRAYNEFATKSQTEVKIPPSQNTIAKQIKKKETITSKNIVQAKSTLARAIHELAQARTSLDLNIQSSASESRATVSSPLANAADDLAKSIDALSKIEDGLKEHSQLSDAMKQLRLSDDEQRDRLIEAAAVGLTARSLSHELHHYVRQLRDGIAKISERNKTQRDEKIREATKLLNSVTRELAKLIATIDPLLPGTRSLKEVIPLHDFLTQYVSARTSLAEGKGIHLNLKIPPATSNLNIKFSRTRLLQVIENLFQNSIYWLTHAPITSTKEKNINIEASDTGFIWSDTGIGISPSLESSIFEAFVSDKPALEGQGLGLHIVATFLEAERCSIHLGTSRNELGRRYQFIITLTGATPEHKQPTLFT